MDVTRLQRTLLYALIEDPGSVPRAKFDEIAVRLGSGFSGEACR